MKLLLVLIFMNFFGGFEISMPVIEKEKSGTTQSAFQPDTTVNRIIVLQRSVNEILGDADKLLDKNSDALDVYYSSRSGKQYLRVIFGPGGSKNCFDQFELGDLSYLKTKPKMHSTNIDSFETENKIRVGLTVDDIIKKKGTSYVQRNDNGFRVLRYSIDDMKTSPFLKSHNMPLYSEEFYFKNGVLIKFIFGFDYP